MKSHLMEIQDTVIKYAKTISEVTGIDVEIVDQQLCRVAGTGVKSGHLGESMAKEGYVYKSVLQTNIACFNDEPGKNSLCAQCVHRNHCDELVELCTPILLGQETIGVIGLICFDKQQQERMLANVDIYREFVTQIADFISAKVYEHTQVQMAEQMVNLLNQIIRRVDLGVIVLNKDGYLEQANEEASKQLSICKADEKIKIDIEFTGDSLLDNEEYKVVIGKKTFQVIGKLIDFTTTINEKSTILLFNNIKKVKSEIYNLTNVNQHQTVNNIIGNTNEIQQLKEKIIKIANSSSTVLIVGESGTGKDLVARAIHSESNRKNNPFVSINCGAIPDTLLESELFGYVKGAFTGADPRGKIGKFEIANKGIIFLDEIGDMPLYLQVKLLRVLQERKISRIGSNQIIDIDVRVIAATNRDLAQLIKENKFRDDLYYRLNVIPIHVPALRERKADIEPLIKNLLMKYCRLFGRNHVDMDKETLAILVKYPWPGNVRELENTIEFMINMVGTDDVITKEYLPENILRVDNGRQVENVLQESTIMSLREVERQYIQQALKIYGSDTDGKLMAARKLGISLATLYRRIDGEKY